MKKNKYFQYFTRKKYWRQIQVLKFIYKYKSHKLIDPFAGNGDLLNSFYSVRKKIGYDIDESMNWIKNDSLKKIPNTNNGFVITNPPYLSRVSSKRKKINHDAFLTSKRSDLYQIALDKILESKMPGVAIVPETFINSSYDKSHIYSITILIPNPFQDTTTPVCIICFDPNKEFIKTQIYKNEEYKGSYKEIQHIATNILKENVKRKIKFNDPKGELALVGYDSSSGNTIQFLMSNKLKYKREIKISSRVISKINVLNEIIDQKFVNKLNKKLQQYRKNTYDILLSPFKGNYKLNNNLTRRRRLDFRTAREIINSV